MRWHNVRIGKYLNPLFVTLVYLFLYLPIVVLVAFSFNNGTLAAGWQGFSLRWYSAMIESPDLLKALKASLIVATSSTVLVPCPLVRARPSRFLAPRGAVPATT